MFVRYQRFDSMVCSVYGGVLCAAHAQRCMVYEVYFWWHKIAAQAAPKKCEQKKKAKTRQTETRGKKKQEEK